MSAPGLHRPTTSGLASPAVVEAIRNACGDLALGGTFTPARAWERYRATTRAKSMLLGELVAAPHDDDLLLIRHRLDAARESWKRELLDRALEPRSDADGEWLGEDTVAAWREGLRDSLVAASERTPRAAAIASIQPYVEEMLLLDFSLRRGDERNDLVLDARALLLEARDKLVRAAPDAILEAGPVLADDLADRTDQAETLAGQWLILLESETLARALDLAEGKQPDEMQQLRLRMKWLERRLVHREEAARESHQQTAGARAALDRLIDEEKLLARRRGDSMLAASRELLDERAANGESEPDPERAWCLIEASAAWVADESPSVISRWRVPGFRRRNSAAPDTPAPVKDATATLRGEITRLREYVDFHKDHVDDATLIHWRESLETRSDDVVSQLAVRSTVWCEAALRELREDVTWLAAESRRREGPASADGNMSRLDHLEEELIDEHREQHLAMRVEALLGRAGAAILDTLVIALVLLVLVMLGARFLFEIPKAYDPALEYLDGLICLVLYAEFMLKMLCAESARWYFRRRWFTDWLPSIPFSFFFANLGLASQFLRSLRLIRVLRAIRVLRLVSFFQRGVDRLVRRLRGILDIRLRFFGEHDESDDELSPLDELRVALQHIQHLVMSGRAGGEDRNGTSARSIADRGSDDLALRLTHADFEDGRAPGAEDAKRERARKIAALPPRETFFLLAINEVGERIVELDAEQLVTGGGAPIRLHRRDLRVEEAIDRLKELDPVRVEQSLGIRTTHQIGGSLRFLAPILLPIFLLPPRLATRPGGELIAAVGRRLAEGLDLALHRAVNWFRDLYGIVGAAELFSFVGGFLAKTFKRHQNRLLIGLLVLAVGYLLIKSSEEDNAWRVTARVELARAFEGDALLAGLRDHNSPFAPRAQIEVGTTSRTIVLSSLVRFSTFQSALAAEEKLLADIQHVLPAGTMEPTADRDGDGIIPEIDATAQPAVLVTIGRALQRSFGAVLIILGVFGFLAVWFGKWLTRRAGQVVDHHIRVAEAQYINLMKDYKRRHAGRDLDLLYRRVLRPELRGDEALAGGDEHQRKILRREAEAATALQFHDETDPGAATPEAPDQTVDEVHHSPIATGLIDRVITLYRDYLDGAVLHRSDVKTTEQILGNAALLEVADRLSLTARERHRLERLDLAKARTLFGPYLWFFFITNAIAQKVGCQVLEFNRRYRSNDFDALHFLFPDERREAVIASRHGTQAVDELHQRRREIIRTVFGTYPLPEVSLNAFRLYRARYEGGIRIFRLPFDLVWVALRGVGWVLGRVVALFRDFLRGTDDQPVLSSHAGFDVAQRKIFRLRRPAIEAALRLRARLDLAYLDVLPRRLDYAGCEGSTVDDDLNEIGAAPTFRYEVERRREIARDRCRLLERFVARVEHRHPELRDAAEPERRAWYTVAAVNERDIADLMIAALHLEPMEAGLVERHGWPEGWGTRQRIAALLGAPLRRFRRWWRNDHTIQLGEEWCRARGLSAGDDRAPGWLRRAVDLNTDGWRTTLALLERRDATADPEARIVQMLEEAGRGADRLEVQLIALRTVQTLSLLDLQNYREIVHELGGYDEPVDRRAVGASTPIPTSADEDEGDEIAADADSPDSTEMDGSD